MICTSIINPIIINGDLLGSLILYSEKENINEIDYNNKNFHHEGNIIIL